MFIFKGYLRKKHGTNNNNYLRLNKKIPAVIYGDKKNALNIILNNNIFFFKKNIYSSIIKIIFLNFYENVLIKNIQYHAYKQNILHIDFQRINKFKNININIPIKFINSKNCPAVKLHSGIINYIHNKINIICLPKYLPKYIIVNLLKLKINNSIYLFDIKLPKGVFFLLKKNIIIVTTYILKSKEISENLKKDSKKDSKKDFKKEFKKK